MTAALLATLAVLALVDSTSIGTLVIPIWFLLAPRRPSLGRMVRYLTVIGLFYLLIGLLLLVAVEAGLTRIGDGWRTDPVLWLQLVLGVALFAWSFRFSSKRPRGGGARLTRFRERAVTGEASGRGVTTIALGAGVLELPTMIPYLAAIGLLSRNDVAPVGAGLALVGHCLLMVLPALLLTLLRAGLHRRIAPTLQRVDAWLTKRADDALGWVIGIAGFLIVRDAWITLF